MPPLKPPYDTLLRDLAAFIPAARLVTDPLRLLAWGSDASFYRLLPKLVVVVANEDEVRRVIICCAAPDLPRRGHQPVGPGAERLGAGAAGRRLAGHHGGA